MTGSAAWRKSAVARRAAGSRRMVGFMGRWRSGGRLRLPDKPRLRKRILSEKVEQQPRDLLLAGVGGMCAVVGTVLGQPFEIVEGAPLRAVRPKIRAPEQRGSVGGLLA